MEEVYSTGSAFAAVLQNRTVITFGNPDGGMKFEPIELIEPIEHLKIIGFPFFTQLKGPFF